MEIQRLFSATRRLVHESHFLFLVKAGFTTFLESHSVDSGQFSSSPVSHYHLSLVGSGLSSTFTLIEYISQLNQLPLDCSSHSSFNIVVFEKDCCLWGGVPYGARSGFTLLLLLWMSSFPSELPLFCNWLSNNIDWLILPFKENAGERSKTWLNENKFS